MLVSMSSLTPLNLIFSLSLSLSAPSRIGIKGGVRFCLPPSSWHPPISPLTNQREGFQTHTILEPLVVCLSVVVGPVGASFLLSY